VLSPPTLLNGTYGAQLPNRLALLGRYANCIASSRSHDCSSEFSVAFPGRRSADRGGGYDQRGRNRAHQTSPICLIMVVEIGRPRS
jgi:hypothetical protein